MEQSSKLIQQLVANFKANEAAYLASNYSESQVRQDFIDKFFTALGWDVTHTKQFNPYEQEVKIENRVTMPGTQRRADYAFSIAPNFDQVKFFVEAKKPSRSLANADDYFQTIRYAWNTKIPIAVLTDFEEFHILDCRYKPNIKTALERKIGEYRYTDYANEETFAKIFHLFGREAVAAGSLEKYAAALPKKGTKQVGGVQPVDDAFLEELDGYREILAKAFKKTNESLQGDELTEAVQRTIDRLVFIRFLEDKGIEDKQIISISDPKTAWKSFVTLCKRFEPKYNGLVFKSHRILDSGEFHSPDGAAVAAVFQKISDPASPYDFNQIPISILGSIYERFLGKVVHATEKRVKVEEKPEVRKAGGVYYTPEYIVRYIVKETVGKLIEGKTPEQIAPMAFADIACGSGSFLIEVYAQVLDYHLQYYINHPEAVGKDVLFERDGKKYLTLKKKKEILTNNVYGVDIDFQATEVTQLSLYLKMLENATMNDAHQFGLFKETILPDLRQNIICGNSLIGRDILEGELFSTIDESKLKPMNYEDAFPKIMRMGGFDAVVGNPPYLGGREWKEENGRQYGYFITKYEVAEYQFDIYSLFWEQGVNIIKPNCYLGLITPNTWLNNQGSKKLRSFLLMNTCIISITDYSKINVFKQAVVLPIVTILMKGSGQNHSVNVYEPRGRDIQKINSILQNIWKSDELQIFNINLNEIDVGLKNKIEMGSTILEEISLVKFGIKIYETGKGNPPQKASDASNKIFESDKKVDANFRPYLEGKDIDRYVIKYQNRWLKYGANLAAPRDPKLFEGERILVRRIVGDKLISTYTSETYVTSQLLQIVKPNEDINPKYILGILNSTLIAYYFKKKYNRQDKTFPEIRIYELAALPIRVINSNNKGKKTLYETIVKYVEQMLESKQKLFTAKTESETNRLELLCSSIDRQIDEAVYELYGLTEEEIKIVEGST